MSAKLDLNEINETLKNLPGWEYKDNSIKKTFKTSSYPGTMGFVTSVGGFCQRQNHHPDYMLVKFKEIEVSFSTHSEGGVTQKDIDIAMDIEKIAI